MRLHGADGLAFARQVSDTLVPLRILVVTGNTAPEDMAALAASVLPVLHKPFRAEALRTALLALLADPPRLWPARTADHGTAPQAR